MGEVRRPVGRHRPQEAQGTTVVCQGSRVVLVPNWYCLSGSSDSMIRLWDIGQQRCIHSYAVHTDSVWALAITPSFSHVYSGGRDQAVPVYKEPSFTIPGVPAIVQHEILNNRRHVLTKETAGSVKSWDITRGVVIEDFGKVSFEDKRNELFEMATIPAWFTMDAQLGCLFVHLDTPQCFSAESYEVDLNIAGAQEEKKLADILYYEILDIPLPELQGLKTLRVAFHHATNNEVSLHFIRLPKGSTLFELIKDIKSKVQLSCSDTELRLFEVFHHRICGGQWVQVKFRRRDFESES